MGQNDLFGLAKAKLGMGFWFRSETEHLLVGTRGAVKPFRLLTQNIVHAPRMRHSAKPAEARRLIDQAVGRSFNDPRKVELFARERHDGWTCYGDALDGCDIRSVLPRD
jgi:N6-adenosine-specific RNA methylase IME4